MSSTPVGQCFLSSIFHRHYSLTFIQSVGIRNIPKADCFSCNIFVTGLGQVYSKSVVGQQERGLDFHGRRRRRPHSVSAQPSSPTNCWKLTKKWKTRRAKKFCTSPQGQRRRLIGWKQRQRGRMARASQLFCNPLLAWRLMGANTITNVFVFEWGGLHDYLANPVLARQLS